VSVTDSPTPWVRKHVERYVRTGGESGHEWRPGVPTLLLTTRGRTSGLLRRTALIYARDADAHLVVASNGGSAGHPAWYLNLDADPAVRVQVGPDEFAATARTATDAERERLWPVVTGIWPDYDAYQRRTDRQIPIVVLDRV
jgi:deazaflavin-dependent oxidoreductase (nitroreductase family)